MAWIDLSKLLSGISLVEVAQRLGKEPIRKGDRDTMLCPFHQDSNPSVVLYEGTASRYPHFHCFSCGEHGDAIALVKQVNSTDFKGAVNWLATSFNVSLSLIKGTRSSRLQTESDTSALEIAASIYAAENSASDLRRWERDRRFDKQALKDAGLAYANANTLADAVASESFNESRAIGAELEEASLLRRILPKSAEQTTTKHLPLEIYYTDAFPGDRIIIPLKDHKGKLVGLVARAAKDEPIRSAPKYLNSKGTQKGNILFFANVVFPKIVAQKKAGVKDHHLYLTEGYFDAIRLNAFNVPAVSVMGAQLSEQQVEIIDSLLILLGKDHSLTVHLLMDRDQAGMQGTARSTQRLLGKNSGVELQVVFLTNNALAKVQGANTAGKDPDECFRDATDSGSVLNCIEECTFPPALAFLVFEFGGTAEDVLVDTQWKSATRSRRYRAMQRTSKIIRKLCNSPADLEKLIFGSIEKDSPAALDCQKDLLAFSKPSETSKQQASTLFITDHDAQLNHARELAYMGSRRGELPCAEPEWERLNIAATAFNVLLKARLAGPLNKPIDLYDAVKVPRKFGGKEARLKAMPRPADLIVQQYLLNELLSERLDQYCLDDGLFSSCIPAVRYYGEGRPTVTTGLLAGADESIIEIDNEQVLSFAYQIDMEVIEGRKPASDQGMYRPYVDSWRDFMHSLKTQSGEIGVVHSLRLDVKRYYDNLQRFVVRDSLLLNLKEGLDKRSNFSDPFAPLLRNKADETNDTKAAQVVDAICDLLFGYCYENPEDGSRINANDEIGIPQGPVLSAWVGNIALFPLDQQARNLMAKHNTEGRRIGYARYVDDLVLLADSADLLTEMRRVIEGSARALGLSLVAKADDIPVLPASEFYKQLNEGRAFAASGPAWEPPMIGDGEQGWGLWAETTETSRQSALQIFRNSGLFRDSGDEIVHAVSTAFKAKDLRPSELAKGARWLWFAVATDATRNAVELNADMAWDAYLRLWERCIEDTGWRMNERTNAWEDPILFALEGLEKLLDSSTSEPHGLSASEKLHRDKCLALLGAVVMQPGFRTTALAKAANPRLIHQLKRRFDLLAWKAKKALPAANYSVKSDLSSANPYTEGSPFIWLDRVVQALMRFEVTPDNPQDALATVEKPRTFVNKEEFGAFNEFAAAFLTEGSPLPETVNPSYLSIALQTIVSVAPRQSVWCILEKRPWLVGSTNGKESMLILPPLPGIPQDRLLVCTPSSESATTAITSVVVFSLPIANTTAVAMEAFLGVGLVGQRVVELSIKAMPGSANVGGPIDCQTYQLDGPPSLSISVTAPQPGAATEIVTPQMAAQLYLQMVEIQHAQFRRNETQELVPAWPFVANAVGASSLENRVFLLSEPVDAVKLAGRAFVRDVGRSLRSISVPQEQGYLWRIGVTVSDLLGLQDDISKLADHDGQLPLSEATLKDPARYVLRSQLRKLRGAYFNEQAYKRIDKETNLPLTLKRSLEIMQGFPAHNATLETKLYHLLISEAETEAMRLRYQDSKNHSRQGLVKTLHLVSTRVISKLPIAVGESLASNVEIAPNDLRRDLLANALLTRRILNLQSPAGPGEAEQVLKASLVLATCYTAFRGLVIALKSLRGFELPLALEWPAGDWPIADSPQTSDAEPSILVALRNEDWRGHTGGSALSWLCVLVGQIRHCLELKEWKAVAEQLKAIANSLAQYENSGTQEFLAFSWPFEQLTAETLARINLELVDNVCKVVPAIDRLCGIGVRTVVSPRYGYSPKEKRFTDSEGRTWTLPTSSICQWPPSASKTEEFEDEGRLQKVWCESFEKSTRKLLAVHVLGDAFARIAIVDHHTHMTVLTQSTNEEPGAVIDAVQATHASLNAMNPEIESRGSTQSMDIPGTPNASITTRDASREESPPAASASPRRGAAMARAFRSMQNQLWSRRGEQKLAGHVRVALLQWKLDETYSHPIAEAGAQRLQFKESGVARQVSQLLAELDEGDSKNYSQLHQATERRGTEYLWTERKDLPSWAEHRRQRLLATAIDVCERFKVDILVLPEYSVRPETVVWLKEELRRKGVAVLAGTFRQFDGAPDKLLGAKMSLLWPYPNDAASELSAALRLDNRTLASADRLRHGVVLEWERLKKYRAVAVEEYIQPSSDELTPLFHPSDIQNKLGISIPTHELNRLLTATPLPLKYCLELICSELFMLTSPANLLLLASDYEDQLNRFLKGTAKNGWETVVNDLKNLAQALAMASDDLSMPRRSLLVVPAATSRTADYWIAGQASLLASGTTTVFCNGVLGKAFMGGSCFVGRESWKNGQDSIGLISTTTPYNGWSKGIYYNKPTDPLGESDQAMVIADIDPLNMQEGKPRPQMLPVPLQLVAYLPIAETLAHLPNSIPLMKQLLGKELGMIADIPPTLIDYLHDDTHGRPELKEAKASLTQALRIGNVDLQVKRLKEMLQHFAKPVPAGSPPAAIDREKENQQIAFLRLFCLLNDKLKIYEAKKFGLTSAKLGQAIHEGNIDDQIEQLYELEKYFSDASTFRARTDVYSRDRSQQPKTVNAPAPAVYDWLEVDLTLKDSEKLPTVNVPSWVKHGS